MMLYLLILCQLFIVYSSSVQSDDGFMETFTVQLLSGELDTFTNNTVIMFHAPWCLHCKQLLPYWQVIATSLSNQLDIRVGVFDCEIDDKHEDICSKFGIEQYPTIAFVGYGPSKQGLRGSLFGSSTSTSSNARISIFESDLYPETVFEWIKWMSWISVLQRRSAGVWNGLTTILSSVGIMPDTSFTSKPSPPNYEIINQKHESEVVEYNSQITSLESLLQEQEIELSRYRTLAMFDSLKNHGDVFALLHGEISNRTSKDIPDSEADPTFDMNLELLPLRMCISDMVAEYCKYDSLMEEKFCAVFRDGCAESFLDAEVCRPSICPFRSARGCAVISSCMLEDVLKHYADAIQDTLLSMTQE